MLDELQSWDENLQTALDLANAGNQEALVLAERVVNDQLRQPANTAATGQLMMPTPYPLSLKYKRLPPPSA